MKKLITLLILCLPAIAGDQTFQLEHRRSGDLGADRPVMDRAAAKKMDMNTAREPVTGSWALDADKEVDLNIQTHVAKSKGYWMTVDASAFDAGIALPVTSRGALVRITPEPGLSGVEMLDPVNLVLISDAGESFSNGSGMDKMVSAEQLARAGGKRVFPAGSAVFRMAEGVGTGELTLFSENMDFASGRRYVIDVFERNTDIELHLNTGNDTYMEGGDLDVQLSFYRNAETFVAETLSAMLVSPEGQEFPLAVDAGRTDLRASLGQAQVGTKPGLWEVKVSAEAVIDGVLVRRDARTAFALVQPTAVFSGDVTVGNHREGLKTSFAMDVAVAGRYEVRALLFGTNAQGQLKPLAVGNAATWMEAGQGALELIFDRQVMVQSGLRQPFVVKDLRLIHQNRMSLLHRQQTAFRITEK